MARAKVNMGLPGRGTRQLCEKRAPLLRCFGLDGGALRGKPPKNQLAEEESTQIETGRKTAHQEMPPTLILPCSIKLLVRAPHDLLRPPKNPFCIRKR